MEFGIDAIDYYLPNIALPIVSLAEKRDIIPEKLEKGLGLKFMALADVNEDTASMAANALLNLIENNKIDPTSIGRIYLGTESAVDAAKPTATYAVGTVEKILFKSMKKMQSSSEKGLIDYLMLKCKKLPLDSNLL